MILKCGTYINYRCSYHKVIHDKYAVHFLHCLDHIKGAGLCWLLIVDNLTEDSLNYCWCKKNILACYIGIHMTCCCVHMINSGFHCCCLCDVCLFQCLFVFINQNISCRIHMSLALNFRYKMLPCRVLATVWNIMYGLLECGHTSTSGLSNVCYHIF